MTTRNTAIRLASLLGSIALAATVMASTPAAADDSWYSPGTSCPSQYQYEPYCDESPAYGLYPPGFYPYYGDWNYNFRNHNFDHHDGDHHDGSHGMPQGGFNDGGNLGNGGNFNHGGGNFSHGGGGFSHGGGGHR